MGRRIRIDFACNDPDNGAFIGRAVRASWGPSDCQCELAADDWFRGFAFTVLDDHSIRLHRRKFPFVRRHVWVGNWCWDSFLFERSVGVKLIQTMRSSGLWHCEGGPTRLFDWFNAPGEMSRVTCSPAPENTDADYLVVIPDDNNMVADAVSELSEAGFTWEGSEHYQQAADTFMSWRKGDVNLIVTRNRAFAAKHGVATAVCKELNLMSKPDRIMVFKAILYGTAPGAPVAVETDFTF